MLDVGDQAAGPAGKLIIKHTTRTVAIVKDLHYRLDVNTLTGTRARTGSR